MNDHFFNGDPFSIALWRIPVNDWSKLRVKVLPYSEALAARLPTEAVTKGTEAIASSTIDKITITSSEVTEVRLTAPLPAVQHP